MIRSIIKNKPKKKIITNKPLERMMNKEEKVWECIHCGRKQISIDKPTQCACSNMNWVINQNLIVSK